MNHVIVIEPHADDAFLSVGGLLEMMAKTDMFRPHIMTVFSGTRKRGHDAKTYADAIGAEWTGLGYEEMGNARVNGAAPCQFGEEAKKILLTATSIYLPLGIGGHPEHKRVIEQFWREFTNEDKRPQVFYYVDQPYASKLKNQAELLEMLHGRKIVHIYRPPLKKYRHIPLFRDQAKFFHFNPAESLMRNFELVVA